MVSHDAGALDVMAALTKDGKTLTVGVVNPTAEAVDLKLALAGLKYAGPATRWHITGPNAEAHNTPGLPRVVDIKRSDAKASQLQVPALSVALFEVPLE